MAHTEQHIEAEIGSQETFEHMVMERLRTPFAWLSSVS
jgi:hypothetical protein